MSWEVLLQMFSKETARPEQVPDDYRPPAVGSRADVASAVRKLFRNVESASDSFITIARSAFAIEISLGDTEPCSQLLLHVHDDHVAAAKLILRLADHFGMRAIDCSTGEFIAGGGSKPSREVSEKEREDEARYRRRLEDYEKNPVPPSEWPLSGLEIGPCTRYVYLSFLPGESPKQQQKAVFRHWGDLFKKHGELPTGIGGPMFVLTLPDGDTFGDFSVSRYPALVTESEAEMIPRVQQAAALVHVFAAATGRRSGEIENRSEFVCADGQRVPLAQCIYRLLCTNADYARQATKKKKT